MPHLQKDAVDASLLIFDRAGTLVWESYGDTVLWNGMNLSGQNSESGVYVAPTSRLEDGHIKNLQRPYTFKVTTGLVFPGFDCPKFA